VRERGDDRPLHVYRLAADDWLASEVGRGSEAAGTRSRKALEDLAKSVRRAAWSDLAARALDNGAVTKS
jgi:hypothetical protein